MITDEKRSEVAAELRRQAAYGRGSLGEWWQRLQDVALGEVDFPKPEQLFNRLADLMDRPTCRNLAKPRGMAPVETGDWFECSECHCKARQNAIGMVVRYCPHCGAEVVE